MPRRLRYNPPPTKKANMQLPFEPEYCRGGGTGRRTGLKIPRLQGRAGSIPALGTKMKNGPLRAIFQSYLSKRGHKVNATLLAPRRITSFSRPQVPCVNREASRPKADRFYLRRQAVLLAKPLHHLDLLIRQA